MTLHADLRLTLGQLELGIELDLSANETVALVGPNGAGKTTVLRCLAGLSPIDAGRIELDGVVLDEPAVGTWVPAERRSIGVVFQDYLLFPHLNAAENVAFGLRSRGFSRHKALEVSRALLDDLALAGYERSKPRELSGGQAQRVALARALATGPQLLLLDEPFAALDAAARHEIRADFRRRLDSFEGVCLLVIHDPIEALMLADRLLVLEAGTVVQSGSPAEITEHLSSPYVARLVGANLYRGRIRGGMLEVDGGGELHLAQPSGPEGAEAFATIRPQSIALFRERPDGTPRNVWLGTVTKYEHERDRVRVTVGGTVPVVAEITPAALAELQLQPGSEVWVAVKATDVSVHPV